MSQTLKKAGDEIRSDRQNRALHKYCKDVANACVEQDISLKKLVREMDIYPSPENIKSIIREIGFKMYSRTSTADLTVKEFMEVIKTFEAGIAKVGLENNFPSYDLKNLLESYV